MVAFTSPSFAGALLVSAATLLLSATTALAGAGFTGKKVVSAYYPSYQMAPADVPYHLYTHLDYFVMTTTPDPAVISTAGISDSQIVDFVTRAHAAGITTSYTVGGWTGSRYFSTHVSTAAGRTTFARTLVAVMQQYGFDGIDIDWEYPGVQGEGSNIVSPDDTANFLLFVQTLRSIAGPDVRLAMAVSVGGMYGADGQRVTDLSGFAAVMDYVTIMSYDITGTWSGYTGPNAPLTSKCQPANNPYSITYAMSLFNSFGFGSNHLLIGFPAYSYSYYVSLPFTQTTCSDGTTSTLYNYGTSGSTCGNMLGFGGTYLYKDLVANGWFKSASRFRRILDKNSQTWVLYNPITQLFVPTEAPGTAYAKARFAVQRRAAGINMFDASGDTADGALVSALRIGLGLDRGSLPVLRKRHLEEKQRRKRSEIH
ncbi:hypothetical protein JCM6882_004609 [Rhodosporidiobolus microsporus]